MKVTSPAYALRIYSSDDVLLNGTSSARDLPGTQRLARGILRLTPDAAYVAIHAYDEQQQECPQPITTVDWDQDWEEEE